MDQDSGRENLGTETQSIQRWVDRLRRGDETARDELFHAAHRRMSRLAVHLLKQFPGVARWEQTDDLVARASMRLLSALESVGLTDARHFLRLAAQHMRWELRDLARHYHGPHGLGKHHHTSVGRRDGEEEQHLVECGEVTTDPQRIAAWTEFHEAVNTLPSEEREIFEMIYYFGLSMKEAGEIAKLSQPTVRKRYLQATSRLGEFLT